MGTLAPIALFTYNRLLEVQQTVTALQRNFLAKESDLFIFSDGGRNAHDKTKVEEVRRFIDRIEGFKSITIIKSGENKGLANSIISGVTKIFETYDTIIVLEDDLVSTANFLNFMNQALNFYANEEKIQSISGYSLPLKDKSKSVFFQHRPGSWGWASWKDRWSLEIFNKETIKETLKSAPELMNEFKSCSGNDIGTMLYNSINGLNDSWYVRWAFNHFSTRRYSVFPAYSYIQNIGFNTDGTHCKNINPYPCSLIEEQVIDINLAHFQKPNPQLTKDFLHYFTPYYKIKARIKLLKTKEGRKQLVNDVKEKILRKTD